MFTLYLHSALPPANPQPPVRQTRPLVDDERVTTAARYAAHYIDLPLPDVIVVDDGGVADAVHTPRSF